MATAAMTATSKRALYEALAPWLALLLPLALSLLISFVVTPAAIERGDVVLSPPCSIKRVTGHDCPTCGLTRAFAAISHGDLALARRYHRGAPYLYAMYVVGVVVALAGSGRALHRLRVRRSLVEQEPSHP